MVSDPIDKAEVLRIYAKRAKLYDLAHHLQTLWADGDHRRLVVEAARLVDDNVTLDVGCGTGLLSIGAASKIRVAGLDQSFEMLSAASSNVNRFHCRGRVGLVCGDACRMPFADSQFDVVMSVYGLGAIQELPSAFEEMWRVSKPRARLSLLEMTSPPGDSWLIRRAVHKKLVEPWVRHFWASRDIPCVFR